VWKTGDGLPGVRDFHLVRFGVLILPAEGWASQSSSWQRAEALGFDHAWTFDHLAWRSFRDSPWFGAVPTLAAAAAVTSRIRLGTLVASPNFRHPVPFARELMTLDHISAGRLPSGSGRGGAASTPPPPGASPGVPASELIASRSS
jgi:alkanesulfonate monooxygenase SsuD/methylene tetrahydromethanopterin reductase-like flavin-dependent oxidoreductase (luciferase family)